jgi:signal transduction histidine kinase
MAAMLSHGFHDMRLPLTSIRGYSDMLANPAMGELSDMQKQFIDTIRNNTRRMEALLIDVSDMSKIWNQTLKVNAKMDMFKNIALMVEKQMRPLADELGRKLEFDIPQGLPILNTDGELLAKALNKMVENALRYARPDAEHYVKVSAAGDGNHLLIRLEDNGIGMSPEEISKLGTPYFRSDNEVVLSYKGSGLGIPIAYGIVQLLGGSVEVTSQSGQGTLFTVNMMGMT